MTVKAINRSEVTNGAETADDWIHDDGSYGFDRFNSDRSSAGLSVNPSGTMAVYSQADDGVVTVTD